MTERAFKRCVAALAFLRIAPAIVALGADGRSLPLIPGYSYGPPEGDTYGFYAAAREFISAWTRVPLALAAPGALLLLLMVVAAVRCWARGSRAVAIAIAATAGGLFTCLAIREMTPTGAGAVGWPIVWSIPLFPLRVLQAVSYHAAFYTGVVILLAANIVTVIATAWIARALLRARFALVAPALLVAWPFVMRVVEGTGSGVYGAWLVDAGLALYSEPLSTALVTVALAAVICRPERVAAAASAGAAMGLATCARVSNATIAGCLFVVLLLRSWRVSAFYAWAGLGVVSIAAVFWSRGYSSFSNAPSDQAPFGLFSWHYLTRSWQDSTVFDWRMLALLLPLPLLGIWRLRRRPSDLLALVGSIVTTAVFYSAYYITALHPRFLFVVLPPLFVLAAAGLEQISSLVPRVPVRAVRPA